MLKYTEAVVGFSEVPEEIALCINISGCPIHCKGCHSSYLWQDIGTELWPAVLSNLIAKNQGITCVAFMGGDADVDTIESLAKWVKDYTKLKVCWYSGRKNLDSIVLNYSYFDYIKIGPYEEDKGGLDKPSTNQKFYKVRHEQDNMLDDITYKFKNNETENKSKSAD